MATKKVIFTFYKIKFDFKQKNLFNFNLENYLSTLDIKQHLFEIGDYKGFLKKHNTNIFIFQKFKKDFLPIIGDNKGNTKEIRLKENEYIIEENGIYFDFDNNRILFHKNSSAFSISSFQKYMSILLKNEIKNFILEPIYTDEHLEVLENTPIIKHLNLKLSKIDDKGLEKLGFRLDEVKKYIELEGTESIEIIIKSKRNHKVSTFEKLKNHLPNFKIFDKFRIKASESYETKGEDFDMIDNILSVSKQITLDDTKRLKTLDLINKLEEIYKEYEPKLRDKNE